MKTKLLVLPLLGLLLVGCSNDTASSTNSGVINSSTGEVTNSSSSSEIEGGNIESSNTSTEVVIKATSVTLDVDTADIFRGGKRKFTATVLPANTTDKVVWSIEMAEGVVDLTDNVTIIEDTVYVNKFATLGDAKYTLKVSAGDVSDTATLNIKELNLGSEAKPLGPKEALDLFTNYSYELSRLDELFVKGTVANAELVKGYDTKYSGDLVNGEDKLHFYSCDFKQTPAPLNGREAILSGKVVDYEGTTQLDKPKMISVGELPNATDFTLTETAVTLKAGETYQIEATESPAGYPASYTYASDNEFVTISKTGLISVSNDVTDGTANITVTMNETVEKTLVVTTKQSDIVTATLDCVNAFDGRPASGTEFNYKIGLINITTVKNGGTPFRWWNNDVRCYDKNTMTLTPDAKKSLVSMVIVGNKDFIKKGNDGQYMIENGTATYDSKTKTTTIVAINAELPVTITCGASAELYSITTTAVTTMDATDFTVAETGEVFAGGSYTVAASLIPQYSRGSVTWTVVETDKATVEGNVVKLTSAAAVNDTITVKGTLDGSEMTHQIVLTVKEAPKESVYTVVCSKVENKTSGSYSFGGEQNNIVTISGLSNNAFFNKGVFKINQNGAFKIQVAADKYVISKIELIGTIGNNASLTCAQGTVTASKGFIIELNDGISTAELNAGTSGNQTKINTINVTVCAA